MRTFYVTLTAAAVLLVTGAVTPPIGIIDGSILTASGILLGFATLSVAHDAIRRGKDIRITDRGLDVNSKSLNEEL